MHQLSQRSYCCLAQLLYFSQLLLSMVQYVDQKVSHQVITSRKYVAREQLPFKSATVISCFTLTCNSCFIILFLTCPFIHDICITSPERALLVPYQRLVRLISNVTLLPFLHQFATTEHKLDLSEFITFVKLEGNVQGLLQLLPSAIDNQLVVLRHFYV